MGRKKNFAIGLKARIVAEGGCEYVEKGGGMGTKVRF